MKNNELFETNSSRINKATSSIRDFINGFLDANSFVETDAFMSGSSFISGEEALGEGVITGYGTIDGKPFYVFAQNSEVLKGSIGKAHADKIIKCMDKAIKHNASLISVIDSAGVRVGEGIAVMEGYAAIIAKAVELKGQVEHYSIIKGNCVGLMSTFAATADFTFASDKAVISLNPPMAVASKANNTGKITDILGAKSQNSSLVSYTYTDTADLKVKLIGAINTVQEGSIENDDDPNRIDLSLSSDVNAETLISALFDNGAFTKYCDNYASEVVCGFGRINGISVGAIINNYSAGELISKEGIEKMTSFVDTLEMFNIPLISLVNSKGIKSCLECEQNGISERFATLMQTIASSCMPKISVICGYAIGPIYAALASKAIGFDYSIATFDSVIAPIAPETAVNLYAEELDKKKSPIDAKAALEQKYSTEAGNPFISAKDGYVDNIIDPTSIRPYVASALLMVLGL